MRRMQRPDIPPRNVPTVSDKPPEKKWAFSWRYWKQVDYFGLDHEVATKNWFISLLDKLKELSAYDIEEITTNSRNKEVWRFHIVDWDAKNIPIRKDEIDWISSGTISEDVEFYQFQISTALGRVIGFFDMESIFQIVLLDPAHNINPGKRYNYQVSKTLVLESQYETHSRKVINLIETIEQRCDVNSCSISRELRDIHNIPKEVYFVRLDPVYSDELEELRTLCKHSDYQDTIIEALLALRESKKASD
jgi:hypothetical protein